jgi:hypothetical protein
MINVLDFLNLEFSIVVNIITSMEEHDINVQVEFMSNSWLMGFILFKMAGR